VGSQLEDQLFHAADEAARGDERRPLDLAGQHVEVSWSVEELVDRVKDECHLGWVVLAGSVRRAERRHPRCDPPFISSDGNRRNPDYPRVGAAPGCGETRSIRECEAQDGLAYRAEITHFRAPRPYRRWDVVARW
jgi:hypothetical protein